MGENFMYKYGDDSIANLFKNTGEVSYTNYGDSVDMAFIEEANKLYIYLEGSYEISDWVLNFWFVKRPYKDMKIPYKVHGGFLRCWKMIKDVVIAKISSKPYEKIIIVGYSHGAALAMLCHECVWYHRPDIRDKSYTLAIEGPRVYAGFKVKQELKERWDRFYLIRNGVDIVTHVPPKLFGFTHVGNIIEIGHKPSLRFIKDHYPQSVYYAIVEYEKTHKLP